MQTATKTSAKGNTVYSVYWQVELHVWHDSPDAGDKECLCSLCLNRIDEGQFPIRVFGYTIYPDGKRANEMRFHVPCFRIADGLLSDRGILWQNPRL